MKVNEKTAISTKRVLLVPYEAHHVLKYHGWMQDPGIQEATASEPLSLQEEYENQLSWRTAHDKLTFIVCEPPEPAVSVIRAGDGDAGEKMRGDINFFLYPDEENEDADGESRASDLIGEVDVMIAETQHRGQGLGEAAVRGLLAYIQRHLGEILQEHAPSKDESKATALRGLMVKIKEGNAGSRALFQKLGFRQRGEVNYFGEVLMVMNWKRDDHGERDWMGDAGTEYREIPYEGPADGSGGP